MEHKIIVCFLKFDKSMDKGLMMFSAPSSEAGERNGFQFFKFYRFSEFKTKKHKNGLTPAHFLR